MVIYSHRLLVAILRIQQSSFVLQTSERVVLEADEALQRLQPSESTVQLIAEVRWHYCFQVYIFFGLFAFILIG